MSLNYDRWAARSAVLAVGLVILLSVGKLEAMERPPKAGQRPAPESLQPAGEGTSGPGQPDVMAEPQQEIFQEGLETSPLGIAAEEGDLAGEAGQLAVDAETAADEAAAGVADVATPQAVGALADQVPGSPVPGSQAPGRFSPPAVSAAGSAANKISLDFKGMDVVEVIKLLATRAGLNIVVGKNVVGKVTLFLKDADISDAFETVLMSNELAFETKGGIMNIITERDYAVRYGERCFDNKKLKIIRLNHAKAAEMMKVLNQMKSSIGRVVVDEGSNTLVVVDSPVVLDGMLELLQNIDMPTQTVVFNLNYAAADKLSQKIETLVSPGIGAVHMDERTNKISVTDYPWKVEEITRLVSAFDEKTPQVLIDAQIIEIKPTDKFEMGVDWEYWIEKNIRLASAMPTSGSPNTIKIGTAAAGALVTRQDDYKGIIDLLRTIGETNILSSPRITALNNEEAKILVGTKDAYITSTISQAGTGTAVTSQSVNFVDVGIKLYVTPTINGDGFVTMKIRPEISSSERKRILSEGQETEIPIVTTSEAETTVTIKDGVTVIIGGLRKDEHIKTVLKVPVLGDIPLLGFFFRKTSDEIRKTELVILLTPHLMSGEYAYTELGSITPKEGAVVKMIGGEIVKEEYPLNGAEKIFSEE